MKAQLNARASALFLVFVVLGVYYPAIFAPINSVDDPGTVNFLLNTDSLTLRDIFTPGGTYYRPLLLASFLADKHLFGLQESFMHLENVIFHLANVLLLFFVARRACLARGATSPVLPLIAALLFAVHPINTESVNWISGRTDPLACIFILLATFFMLKPAPTPVSSLCAALSMLAACLAKETAIFFLPAALLFPFFVAAGDEQRPPGETALRSWPHLFIFSATAAGFFAFRSFAFRNGDAGVAHVVTHVGGSESAGAVDTIRLLLKSAGFYLKKLLLPYPLNFGIIQVSELYLVVGVLLSLVLLWLLTRRTLSAYFFLCAACVACSALMVPLLNLTWTPLAERYMYIPCAFFVLGSVFGVESWPRRDLLRPVFPAVVLLLVVAVYGTASRTLLWQDNLALFQDTLKKSPGFVPAQNEMAIALMARGEKAKAAEVVDSMQVTSSIINYQYGLMTKAAALVERGDLDGAILLLQQALKEPGKHEAQICAKLLAVYQMKVENGPAGGTKPYGDSTRLLSRMYELTGDPFYLYRRGIVHMALKERSLARESFEVAAAKAPQNAVYREPALKLSQKMADRQVEPKEP